MTIPAGLNNHVEMVYRPGGLEAAMKLLTLLGCEPQSSTHPFQGVYFHYAKSERLWLSEVTKEQWAFEEWLQRQLSEHGDSASSKFIDRLGSLPQAHGHFGIGTTSLEEWERIVRDLQAAAETDPDLVGHVSVPVVQPPEHPDSVCGQSGGKMGKTLYQAFIRTDLIATGLLTLGQAIEVQHYRENDPTYTGEFQRLKPQPA